MVLTSYKKIYYRSLFFFSHPFTKVIFPLNTDFFFFKFHPINPALIHILHNYHTITYKQHLVYIDQIYETL